MGRGTARSAVEGLAVHSAPPPPSAVPLPIGCADREDWCSLPIAPRRVTRYPKLKQGEGALRPKSIVTFEILSLAALALGLLVSVLSWDVLVASARSAVLGSGLEAAIAILLVFYVAVLLLLILLASRRASNVARWLLALIVAAEVAFSVPGLGTMLSGGTVGILSAVQLVMMAVAVILLFAPDSNRWFRGIADG